MNCRNYGCRITTDVTLKGNQAVIMENQLLRLTILTDRGSDIIELLYKPEDLDFMWRSPVRLHKKADYISSTGNSLGNYLDHNSGGWQEILPNGGSECYYKGACLGMHGEVSNVPWNYEVILDSAEQITLRLMITTLRSPFRIIKNISLKSGDGTIYIEEELTNLAQEPMELMWGHHPTIGEPFLDSNCRIYTNASSAFTLGQEDFDTQRLPTDSSFAWPLVKSKNGSVIDLSVIPTKENQTADMLYLSGFPKEAEYEVRNHMTGMSIGMKWDGELFPYLWMWLVCGGANGYPWYGRTYNLALEPWTSFSQNGLIGAVDNNSSLKMEPGETKYTTLSLGIKKKETEHE